MTIDDVILEDMWLMFNLQVSKWVIAHVQWLQRGMDLKMFFRKFCWQGKSFNLVPQMGSRLI